MKSITSVVGRNVCTAILAGCALLPQARGQTDGSQSLQTLPGTSLPGIPTQMPPRAHDQAVNFIKEAVRNNSLEVAMAELGVRKSQNPELKEFSQQLLNDHKQANEQLRPIAQKHGVDINQTFTRKQQRELSKLQKLSGEGFDQRLAIQLLRGHQKDIERFQEAATQLQASDVKQYAQNMLPKLQQHFQHGESVAKTVGVDQDTIASIAEKAQRAMGGSSDTQQMQQGSGASEGQESGASRSDK